MSNTILQAPCPENSIIYNKTLCHCSPGYLFNASSKSCMLFNVPPSEWVKSSVIKHSNVDENYQEFLKSDELFLTTIAVGLLMWLLVCALVRFGRLGDGRNAWFQIRWWISRLDVTFANKHWLADQTAVKKRKTELGGTFSIASWIVFIGLLVALFYQIIARRGTEVYGLKATHVTDLLSFTNDLELNITTISGMTCSQLRGLDTVAVGTPGFIDYRTVALSTFASYSCLNSTKGPTVSLKLRNCSLFYNHIYISWQFINIEHTFPATAVGFQFNFTAKNHANEKEYINFVGGTIKNEKGNLNDERLTFRGEHTNFLKFNMFPRVHRNLNDLKLLQPLFHEFRPGSFARDESELRTLLQSSKDGLINTTVALNFMSDYLVEIDDQKYAGPVTFIADVGGLYCISIAIFLLLLSVCESRIKRLRTEDQVMLKIRNRRIAVDRWDKLRKFVAYTYGCRLLNESYDNTKKSSTCCMGGNGSVNRSIIQQEAGLLPLSFLRQASSPAKVLRHPTGLTTPEVKAGSAVDVSDLRKEIESLKEYNAILREKLVHAQSMLDALTTSNQTDQL